MNCTCSAPHWNTTTPASCIRLVVMTHNSVLLISHTAESRRLSRPEHTLGLQLVWVQQSSSRWWICGSLAEVRLCFCLLQPTDLDSLMGDLTQKLRQLRKVNKDIRTNCTRLLHSSQLRYSTWLLLTPYINLPLPYPTVLLPTPMPKNSTPNLHGVLQPKCINEMVTTSS